MAELRIELTFRVSQTTTTKREPVAYRGRMLARFRSQSLFRHPPCWIFNPACATEENELFTLFILDCNLFGALTAASPAVPGQKLRRRGEYGTHRLTAKYRCERRGRWLETQNQKTWVDTSVSGWRHTDQKSEPNKNRRREIGGDISGRLITAHRTVPSVDNSWYRLETVPCNAVWHVPVSIIYLQRNVCSRSFKVKIQTIRNVWRNLARPAWRADGYMFCRCYCLSSSFNGPLGDLLSQNILDRSSPNFQDRWTYVWTLGIISQTFFSWSLKGRCYGNRLLARIAEKWHTPPVFCAVLAFHNRWQDRNTDARVNTTDDPSTSDKNWENFSPITPAFCRSVFAGGGLHAGLCRAFLITCHTTLLPAPVS